jgi:hypothetical protein
MQRFRVPAEPKFVYLVIFLCPDCQKPIVSGDFGELPRTEADLKTKTGTYPVSCECGFKGGLHGSAIASTVELQRGETNCVAKTREPRQADQRTVGLKNCIRELPDA